MKHVDGRGKRVYIHLASESSLGFLVLMDGTLIPRAILDGHWEKPERRSSYAAKLVIATRNGALQVYFNVFKTRLQEE